ncbi:hypothetical protein BJ944DRAFT_273469 [Cunninghamella echinulata]|nr:hypothetical protein BJ944DRAFT_273469 [Cunninghamella echinulata]
MTNPPQLETTPRTYYEKYVMVTPSYDLYPSLNRRLSNGYVHQPTPPVRRQTKKTNFISMNIYSSSSHRVQPQDNPSWDLYPSILRNVENFGTDQMRQRLHTMETTM